MNCTTCGAANCFEHGGEVDDDQIDEELHGMVAEELMGALERKDKKGILEAIRAIALSCGGK